MIEHHVDCVSHEDDNFCDCDFWDRLKEEQEEFDNVPPRSDYLCSAT